MTPPSKDINTNAHSLAGNKQQTALELWDAYLERNCEQEYRKSMGYIHIKTYRANGTAGINRHIFTETNSGRHCHFY